ncbi:response regulator [Hyalangium rubrum]|uniref:Response regulator n=1 Tax=Hyalangium rubrum TaxID=3103134 RepID=A0ABU5HI00_9BACT|nr:response regulator [Hyalangium sp. s54d21]MDY7233091.1 response regulator [Hyalangium sp. s54d21]
MRRVLVVSPHPASRALLQRFLAEPEVSVSTAKDADAALSSIALTPPAVVVVDLRRPDEDHPLFLALLRKRHPTQPVIALVPGSLRVFDGSHERVHDVRSLRAESAEGLHQMLSTLKEALDLVLAQHFMRIFRSPVGQA